MKVKTAIMVGLMSVAIFASTTSSAKPYKGDIKIYRMMVSERGIQKLDLTTIQVEQIKRIYESEKAAMSLLKQNNKKYRATMRSLIQADYFDREAYLAAINAGQRNQAELALLRGSNKHKLRNILTLEQQKILNKLKKKRRNKMESHMQDHVRDHVQDTETAD